MEGGALSQSVGRQGFALEVNSYSAVELISVSHFDSFRQRKTRYRNARRGHWLPVPGERDLVTRISSGLQGFELVATVLPRRLDCHGRAVCSLDSQIAHVNV